MHQHFSTPVSTTLHTQRPSTRNNHVFNDMATLLSKFFWNAMYMWQWKAQILQVSGSMMWCRIIRQPGQAKSGNRRFEPYLVSDPMHLWQAQQRMCWKHNWTLLQVTSKSRTGRKEHQCSNGPSEREEVFWNFVSSDIALPDDNNPIILRSNFVNHQYRQGFFAAGMQAEEIVSWLDTVQALCWTHTLCTRSCL